LAVSGGDTGGAARHSVTALVPDHRRRRAASPGPGAWRSYGETGEAVRASEEELLTVINDEIRSIEGARETETFMHRRTEKNVFA
jgi:hypothetical protein